LPGLPDTSEYLLKVHDTRIDKTVFEAKVIVDPSSGLPLPVTFEADTAAPTTYEFMLGRKGEDFSVRLPFVLRVVNLVACEEALRKLAIAFRDEDEPSVQAFFSSDSTNASRLLLRSFKGPARERFANALLSPRHVQTFRGTCTAEIELPRPGERAAQVSISLFRSVNGDWKVMTW
jgi:hypothetical protein